MKMLRWAIVAIVVLYAAWIAFPVVKAIVLPDNALNAPSMAADNNDVSGGYNTPMDTDAGPSLDSIQGETAVDALETHNTPVLVLWAAVVLLYLAAAFLHAHGNLRATFVYGLGFIADAILTYLANGQKQAGLFEKLFDILSAWDPRYVLTLVALVMGFLIYMSRFNPKMVTPGDPD